MLAALPLAAQEQPKKAEDNKPQVQRVFILKYADPVSISQLLSIFGVQRSPNFTLHALAVSGSPDVMPAVEDAIKRLDVPAAAAQNVELNVYYLVGGDADIPSGGPVPKELDSVVVQLRNSFAFKTYRLLDTLTLRTRTGAGADTSGSPGPVAPGGPAISTQFRMKSAGLSGDGSTLRIDGLKAGVRMPVAAGGTNPSTPNGPPYQYMDLGLNADVDVKEGQKVVVGRLSVNKEQALFLVLTARVVN
jgi:hypothetical protein